MTTKKEVVDNLSIPYLGPTGQPYHTLNEPQRRWLTKGLLTTQEEADLVMHSQMVAERVMHYQALRRDCRKQAGELMKVREDTPEHERQRRLDEVDKLKLTYADAEEAILHLKNQIFEVQPGNMMLPEVI